jgi:hypothetical protein
MSRILFCWFALYAAAAAQTVPAPAQTPAPPAQRRGTVRGTVKDETGAVIPNATVVLTDQAAHTQTTTTTTNGSYTFPAVPAGTYTVSVQYTGMQQSGVVAVNVQPGRPATGDVQMAVQEQRQEVTVTESVANQLSTEPSNNASALVLRQEVLDALPDDPDDLESDLTALAGPAAGPGGSQIFLDGFTGGTLPPKSSIREIRINSNPFSAEYDKLGYGRIEIFTKPGTDKFHGQVFFDISDSVWNSRNPFLNTNPAFRTERFGGNLGGPLGKKASFFLDVDRRNIDDNGIVNAIIPTQDFAGGQSLRTFYPTPQRRTHVTPRLDYQLTSNNTLTVRYSFLENDHLLAGIGNFDVPPTSIGGLTLPSTGYTQSTGENMFQLVDTAVLSSHAVNETRFQFVRDNVTYQSRSDAPQLNVTSSFVAGGSGYSAPNAGSSYDIQQGYEFQNYATLTFGAHTVKTGIRIRASQYTDYSPRNFNGTFTFLGGPSVSSLTQYLTTERLLNSGLTSQQVSAMGFGPSLYTVSSGKPLLTLDQLDFGPYIQDDWRVRPNLTLSLGLRWEAQTNIPDKNDWAPRVAFAWSPGAKASRGRPATVIRAGWGLFYERFPAASVLNAYRFNGTNQLNYIVRNPTDYNSAFSAGLPISELQVTNASQTYQIDPNLHAPRLMQTVVSLERQVLRRTNVTVSYRNTRGTHILRTADINAPLPGTYEVDPTTGIAGNSGVRPYGDTGDIYDYQSTGIFKQTQVTVGVNSSAGRWLTLFSRYTYGNAHSDTDGLGTMPSNPYNFAQDWGRSNLDIAHMIFVGGAFNVPHGIRLSPFLIAHTGTPFDITTGTNIYGTGQIVTTVRPSIASGPGANVITTPFGYLNEIPQSGQPVIGRNAGTGPGFVALNFRLAKTWGFGPKSRESGFQPGGGGPGHGPGGHGGMFGDNTDRRYALTLSFIVRNILNHENPTVPVGVITSPFFLHSTGITGGFGPESVASNQRRMDIQLRFTF